MSAKNYPAAIFGIEVTFEANYPGIAEARGFFWQRRILVGPKWLKLEPKTARAVLTHEARHILGYHREQRVALLLVMFMPALLLLPWKIILALGSTLALYLVVEKAAQWHEFDADRFAVKNGLGRELLGFVRGMGPPPTLPTFYPDYQSRCDALEQAILKGGKDAVPSS